MKVLCTNALRLDFLFICIKSSLNVTSLVSAQALLSHFSTVFLTAFGATVLGLHPLNLLYSGTQALSASCKVCSKSCNVMLHTLTHSTC